MYFRKALDIIKSIYTLSRCLLRGETNMAIKSYIKRLLLYIRHGDPKINLDVSYLSEGAMLAGKTVIITGGAKGLGFAIAKSFIAQGASVIITGRDMDSLNNAKCQLGDMCSIRAFDITDAKMYRTFLKMHTRPLDVLIYCLIMLGSRYTKMDL